MSRRAEGKKLLLCTSRRNVVEQTPGGLLERIQSSGIEVVGFEPALFPVVCVVAIGVVKNQGNAGSRHPEYQKFEEGRNGIELLQQSVVEPPALRRKNPVVLPFYFVSNRFKGHNTTSLYYVETQPPADKAQVLHYLRPAIDPLDHDAGENLPKKARTMKHKAEPVEELLHDCRDLERIVG